jgi:hypothetical protein
MDTNKLAIMAGIGMGAMPLNIVGKVALGGMSEPTYQQAYYPSKPLTSSEFKRILKDDYGSQRAVSEGRPGSFKPTSETPGGYRYAQTTAQKRAKRKAQRKARRINRR